MTSTYMNLKLVLPMHRPFFATQREENQVMLLIKDLGREAPIPIYLGLTIHTASHSKKLI